MSFQTGAFGGLSRQGLVCFMLLTRACREGGPCGHSTSLRVTRAGYQAVGVLCHPALTVTPGGSTAGSVSVPVGHVHRWNAAPRPLAASSFPRKEEEAQSPRKARPRRGWVVDFLLLLAATAPLSQAASPNL